MTLFTANALICGRTRAAYRGIQAPDPAYVARAYRDWLRTQRESFPLPEGEHFSWLLNVPELFCRRAPGGTCLTAIAQGAWGTIQRPINQSKGCGGIMRAAPAGLLLTDPAEAGFLAARIAALTHGHELGYLPAGILGYCVSALVHGGEPSLSGAVRGALSWVARAFPGARHLPELTILTERAIGLAEGPCGDTAAIRELGEGWVAEETLAIAVYCALRYEGDFGRALIAAVNHGGDSDSTGAVAGNLLGARLGLAGIPPKYLERLELRSVITELADDLWRCSSPSCGEPCPPETPGSPQAALWARKYVAASYAPGPPD